MPKLILPPRKWLMIGLAFLCIESALIDHILDAQEADDAQASRWNTALIHEIDALNDDQ